MTSTDPGNHPRPRFPRAAPVPTEFQARVDATVTDGERRAQSAALLETKRTGGELRRGPRNAVISAFVERELARLTAAGLAPAESQAPGPLNDLFRRVLLEVNGNCLVAPDPA